MIKVIPQNPEKSKIPKEIPFPKLMINKSGDIIGFFITGTNGIVIQGNHEYKPGWDSNYWISSQFQDYNLPITIQNEIPE